MKSEVPGDNTLQVMLEAQECLLHRVGLLRSDQLSVSAVPVSLWGAPVSRLRHGAFWLNAVDEVPEDALTLVGTSPVGRFVCCELSEGQEVVVDMACFAGVCVQRGRSAPVFKTYWGGFLSPAWWAWGHPVASVVVGPGTLILYEERLRVARAEESMFVLNQVCAFGAETDVEVVPLRARGWLSHVINATSFRSRAWVKTSGLVVVRDFQSERGQRNALWWRFMLHGLISVLVFVLAWWVLP